MSSNETEHNGFWSWLDKFLLVSAAVAVLVLIGAYILIANLRRAAVDTGLHDFLQAIITNLIPVLLVFIIGFILFKQLQDEREKIKRIQMADEVRSQVTKALSEEFQGLDLRLKGLEVSTREVERAVERLTNSVDDLQQEVRHYRELLPIFFEHLERSYNTRVGASSGKTENSRRKRAVAKPKKELAQFLPPSDGVNTNDNA